MNLGLIRASFGDHMGIKNIRFRDITPIIMENQHESNMRIQLELLLPGLDVSRDHHIPSPMVGGRRSHVVGIDDLLQLYC